MDSLKCWLGICKSLSEGHLGEAEINLADLLYWVSNGGFSPDLPSEGQLREFRGMLRRIQKDLGK